MKKRLLCLLLVACLLLPMIPVNAMAVESGSISTQNPFTDVKQTDWFYDSVQYARVNGFFNGVSATLFAPNGTMTRGMFVTVLGRMAGVDPESYSGLFTFWDVSAKAYYAPYVAWAAKHGITTGTGNGLFSPDAYINREQMATFFVRYFDAFNVNYQTGANITTEPADMSKISDYAKEAVKKLWKEGMLNGDGVNFNPFDDATRAQAATLCTRMDASVATWYWEPGVASTRVRINPATGLPFVTPGDDSGSTTPTDPPSGGGSTTPSDPPVANKVTVTFNVNGGTELAEADRTKQVTCEASYGTLPVPTKTGQGFVGWFTAAEGGTQVTAETKVTATENHTLYAHWQGLQTIPESVFNFGQAETLTYASDRYRQAEFSFTPENGATYEWSEFQITYKRHGSDTNEAGLPKNAGTYDVIVTRPADSVYAAFEATYQDVLVINKAIRPARTGLLIRVVESGYTWVKMELVDYNPGIPGVPPILNGGIPDLSEDATVIFNVFTQSGTFSSEPGSPYIWDIPHTGAALKTSVTVIDPNYEDWTSGASAADAEEFNLYLEKLPTVNWQTEGKYDTAWWNETDTSFTIDTAAELAGLAHITNSGMDTFFQDTITLGADIDLTGYEWTPIGTKDHPFTGVFNGADHTVSGMCICNTEFNHAGLFGYIAPGTRKDGSTIVEASRCVIKNLVVDDSYITNSATVGGIVGHAQTGVGSLAPAVENHCVDIINCVSHAEVSSSGMSNNYAGGIIGSAYGKNVNVANCVSFADVAVRYGSESGSSGGSGGGIAGVISEASVVNCVNFGPIVGESEVGGIVGATEVGSTPSRIYNCYNIGRVTSFGHNYIGAICGRNESDEGKVQYCYYLNGSATGADNKVRAALGKRGGSVADGDKGYITASFTTLADKLGSTADRYADMTLIDALNSWKLLAGDAYGASSWAVRGDGRLVPGILPISRLRD